MPGMHLSASDVADTLQWFELVPVGLMFAEFVQAGWISFGMMHVMLVAYQGRQCAHGQNLVYIS